MTHCNRARRGFTTIELLIVMAIMGLVASIAWPRASTGIASNALRSAKLQVRARLVRARATAVQQGSATRFVRSGNTVKILLEQGAALTAIGATADMYSSEKVTVATSSDTIRFDRRGFAPGITSASNYQIIRLSRGTLKDSLCVSRLGVISDRATCQ
ncbi:MAG: prepilin-type N-terminal cleavage/methylation domain-containing protein [Gemmatimonadaceae bacterium]